MSVVQLKHTSRIFYYLNDSTSKLRLFSLRWLPTIPENVKLLRTHSPVTKFILNTPKTGQCEYFQEKHEGHYYTYNEK